MTRENLYVLASRARERTTLYVATHDAPYDEDDRTDRARTDPYAYAAREILHGIIATEAVPLSATETITTAQDEAGSLATLVPRYQHAARQQAGHRYTAAAMHALGGEYGSGLVSDPAWSAVVLRLHDAEADGWDPVRLLALAASQRELGSAGSIAEVMAWRIDAHLSGNHAPPGTGRLYETMPAARDRLAEVVRATLGPQVSDRAQAELAWPALLAALHRAEAADFDAGGLLSHVSDPRELRIGRSISETLAVNVSRHLAASPGAGNGQLPTEAPLPWMASPNHPGRDSTGISRYLTEAASLISSRVSAIARTAVRHRPSWMQALGQPPGDPEHERQWLRAVAIVAAYREQFAVTTSDPGQPLGPYAESATPAHKPYWHAAESLLTARRLAGLAAASASTPDAQAHALVAVDIYRALTDTERAAVSKEMAKQLGPQWLGSPSTPDEEAATQPVHGSALATALAEHGHLKLTEPAGREPASYEPAEATPARHAPGRKAAPTQGRPGPGHGHAPAVAPPPRHEPSIRPSLPAQHGHHPRL
jgi:hypothetical protein